MFESIKKSKIVTLIHLIMSIILLGFYIVNEFYIENPFLDSVVFKTILIIVIILLNTVSFVVGIRRIEIASRTNYVKVINTLGADISEAYTFGEIGILIYGKDNEIIWSNNLFEDRNINLVGLNIFEKYTELKQFFNENPADKINVTINNRIYSVIHLKELSVLIFKDITDIENIYNIRQEESPVIITITLDDLANISGLSSNDGYLAAENQVRNNLIEWAKDNNILLTRIRDDCYLGITTESTLKVLEGNNFDIIKKIRNIYSNKEYSLTVSVGVGCGVNDFVKLSGLSNDAIEVCQARGGNQVVVKNYTGNMGFFGGEVNEIKDSKRAIKTKQLASSFYSLTKNINNVVILTHKNADFDGIGAALGLREMLQINDCNIYLGIDKKDIELKARMMLEDCLVDEELDKLLISEKDALALKGSLLVICADCNSIDIISYPKLLAQSPHVAVIDHHRKGERSVDNAAFTFIDPNSSSTCEMISNMISEYPVNIQITGYTANFLYAGILLDTSNFRNKVSSNTFKQAEYLQDSGASISSVNAYMKDEYEEFELKTKIMSTMESPYFGLMIATSEENINVDRTILAKVANDMLNVKGISTSFVIGNISDSEVQISGRSDGSVNVQMLLEKLGGGGHFTSAAVVLKNTSIKQAKSSLLSVLEVYLNESKQ